MFVYVCVHVELGIFYTKKKNGIHIQAEGHANLGGKCEHTLF